MPSSDSISISVAHKAIAPGLSSAARTLVATAARRPLWPSSSRGMATTLDRKIGAASTLPRIIHASKRELPPLPSTTMCRKSAGLSTGAGAKPRISAAEVSTQPEPASASSRPKRTRRLSCGTQAASAVCRPGFSPRSRLRLTAYRPVATRGATSRKPLNAPARNQKWLRASQSRLPPKSAATRPCSRPGTGQRSRSAQPFDNQCSGRSSATGCTLWARCDPGC
jgi:hypothetical protein